MDDVSRLFHYSDPDLGELNWDETKEAWTGEIDFAKRMVRIILRSTRLKPSPEERLVNTLTGEGLAEALKGTQVVVDVSNSPSWADAAVLEFFETSTRNILAAETAAGVRHQVALSVVGADRLPDSGYMRAKVAQERLINGGKVPYTIVRATQFFEFVGAIAGPGADGGEVRLPDAPMQPLAADDVAAALADVATGAPANAILELAGPEKAVHRRVRAAGTGRRRG